MIRLYSSYVAERRGSFFIAATLMKSIVIRLYSSYVADVAALRNIATCRKELPKILKKHTHRGDSYISHSRDVRDVTALTPAYDSLYERRGHKKTAATLCDLKATKFNV